LDDGMSAMPMTVAETEPEAAFDFGAHVNEMRCHSNESLRSTVREARCERERWRLRELAATRVLDERDALGEMPDGRSDCRRSTSSAWLARCSA
jgi:hypothetical protein